VKDDVVAVVSAGSYSCHMHLTRQITMPKLIFTGPSAFPDARPTVSKCWWQSLIVIHWPVTTKEFYNLHIVKQNESELQTITWWPAGYCWWIGKNVGLEM